MPDYSGFKPKDLGAAREALNKKIAEKIAEGSDAFDSELMELIDRRDRIHDAIPNRAVGFRG